MKKLSETLAYFAGYFDGEGSIIFRDRKSGRRVMNHIAIVNSDKAPLIELQQMFGGNLAVVDRKITGGNLRNQPQNGFKVCYSWQLAGSGARQFLLSILPYLRHKDRIEKAKRALTFDEERGSQTYGNRTHVTRGPRSKAA